MFSSTARILLLLSVVGFSACAHTSRTVDPLHGGLAALSEASIAEVAVSTDPGGENARPVTPEARNQLIVLLHALRPARDVVIEPPSIATEHWHCLGIIFVNGPASPRAEPCCPYPVFFYKISLCRESASRESVVAFVYGSNEAVLAPYEGQALLNWLRQFNHEGA